MSVSKTIELSGAKGVGHFVLVDDEDFPCLIQHRWYLHKGGYAYRNMKSGDRTTTIMLHRQILDVPVGLEVDHIDRDPLNNMKSNLRVVTHAKNLANTVNREIYGRKPTSTPYKGVSFYKSRKRYVAEIMVSGKKHYLGQFLDSAAAARAYDEAAMQFHGREARLNFVRLS